MKLLLVIGITIILSQLVSGAFIAEIPSKESETFELDITKIKEKPEELIKPKPPVEPIIIPVELEEIDHVRLNNYKNSVRLNLLDYTNTGKIKWTIEESEYFSTILKNNLLTITYNGAEEVVFEEIIISGTSRDKKSASTKILVTYVNIEDLEAPSSGFPEINLFQERDYPSQEVVLGTSATQTLNLYQGWNFVSFSVKPNNDEVDAVFSSIIDSLVLVQSYVFNKYENEWKNYVVGAPEEIQTLKKISPTQGYWVYLTSAKTLNVQGLIVENSHFELNKGWNMIGYPRFTSLDVSTAIDSIKEHVEIVWGYEDGVWKSHVPNIPEFLNTLNDFEKGKSYWIKTDSGLKIILDDSKQKFVFTEMDNNNYETKSYAYLNGKTIAQNDNGEIKFYHHDYLGNARVITNSHGDITWSQLNYPFGGQLNGSGKGNSKKFLGKEYDYNTGLIYMDARYLDPETGRFISADPEEGNTEVPMSINKYSYAYNNPLRYVDSNGKGAFDALSIMADVEAINLQIEMMEMEKATSHAGNIGMNLYVERYGGTPVEVIPEYLKFKSGSELTLNSILPDAEVTGDGRVGVGVGLPANTKGFGGYLAVSGSLFKDVSQGEGYLSAGPAGFGVSSGVENRKFFFRMSTSLSEGFYKTGIKAGLDSNGFYLNQDFGMKDGVGGISFTDQSASMSNAVIIGPGNAIRAGLFLAGDVKIDFTPEKQK